MVRQEDTECLLLEAQGCFTKYAQDGVSEACSSKGTDPFTDLLEAFLAGHYEKALHTPIVSRLIAAKNENETHSPEETLHTRVTSFINSEKHQEEEEWKRQFTILLLGVTGLQLFVQNNWSGPNTEEQPASHIPLLSKQENYVHAQLIVDEEDIYTSVRSPEYLWLAKTLLGTGRHLLSKCRTLGWWSVRYVSIHQQVLKERCPSLMAIASEGLDRAIKAMDGKKDKDLAIQLHLEAFYVSSYYYEHNKAKGYLSKARELANFTTDLTGVLGKRTRFQERDIAQLTLRVQRELVGSDNNPVEEKRDDHMRNGANGMLPKDLRLNDEVRLEAVKFKDDREVAVPKLSAVDQAVILAI